MAEELDDRFLNASTDALGGKYGDDQAAGRLSDDKSERYEGDARNTLEIKDSIEDMSRTDSPTVKGADTSALSYITGWHPFLRFLFRVADMKYAFEDNRGKRAYRFIKSHKKTFWVCFWCDWALVLIGSCGAVALALIAIAKTLGFM
ncbi:hypothetical protein [Bifidobacterium callimiconis]|uniref:Uncharacterized protein n=1 Tax=Bifidobacterium callimiconis TaxID=2306973 RepID=A0A430FIG4_9BIFI|nr:hypothetical protein [Bifidobacterium callimiconis]RSX52685.1 hypothetical protein D2E23_0413 [Bifidobacterium callimiconis]